MHDAASTQEQQRLEEGVGDQVEVVRCKQPTPTAMNMKPNCEIVVRPECA